jgi:hypothetical protein
MASEIDICNLALGHFGADANVSAITPPDGSAEAEHCQRFYPIARNELLEGDDWTFAGKYALLAQLTNDRADWAYKFALPADCLKPRRLLPDGYSDAQNDVIDYELVGSVLYCDDAAPTLAYTWTLTDTTKFSPMFVTTLSWRLASYIAGPLVKDATGRIQANLYNRSLVELGKAATSNANSSRKRATHTSTAARAR